MKKFGGWGYLGIIYPMLLVIGWIVLLVFAIDHASTEEKIIAFFLMAVITLPIFIDGSKKKKEEFKQNEQIAQAMDAGYEIIIKKLNAKYDILYTNNKGSFLVVNLEFQKCTGNIFKLNDNLDFDFAFISDDIEIGYASHSIKTSINNIESIRLEINENDIYCFGKPIKLNKYKNIMVKIKRIYHNENEVKFKILK